jgi:hypothetical protein
MIGGPTDLVNSRLDAYGQNTMHNMLTIRQHLLIVLFGMELSLLIPVLITVFIHCMLPAWLRIRKSTVFVNYLPHKVDSASLKRHIKTFSTIAGKLSIIGVIVASSIAGALLLFRSNGETELAGHDDRLNAVLVVTLWFTVFNLFFPRSCGDEYIHQRGIVGIFDGDRNDAKPRSMIPQYHYLVAMLSERSGPALIPC